MAFCVQLGRVGIAHLPHSFAFFLVGGAHPTVMSNYRRARTAGGCYFFTVVTYARRPILTLPESRFHLREVITEVRENHPFTIDGWVLLPDHLHCLWTLPEGDANFSKRWGLIKAGFTKRAKTFLSSSASHDTRWHRHEGLVWQRRFWEHEIRDETDFRRHLDYIHINPVKHELVSKVSQWPHSTFHCWVKQGVYSEDWAGIVEDDGSFGE
jgi:putative transposase